MLAMRPHTKSLCSVKRSGPGWSPHTKRPAMITAEVGDPGTPSVTIGTSDATPAESAVACGPMIPLISPLPKSCLFLAYCRARP
jgi:hypothetical protein